MTDEPGRELDALVHLRVFGIITLRATLTNPFFDSDVYDENGWLRAIPHYSTDIAAAWMVVEKMNELGYWAEIHTPFFQGHPFFSGFTPHHTTGWNGRPDFQAPGDTAPLAICRAALKAMKKKP